MPEGTPLVGRVPSELERWLTGLEANRSGLLYTHAGDPGSRDLGLVLRAQRAGDVVRSRPLFTVDRRVEATWDCLPAGERSRC
ncbi:hypothetical protein [Streptomyces sp. NRRL B-24484]|uniref:hypothetical protein n=1 Tax=Streptomyces sp. NRRL B-24484 TaxID=1463833 RepID=UPI000694181E|nr:hypothetical protein [Streptomyces sp. NRRL B-24484]